MQISMVSAKGMLVNRESTSELPIKKSGCWLTTSLAKWTESFMVNTLVVRGLKVNTKGLSIL